MTKQEQDDFICRWGEEDAPLPSLFGGKSINEGGSIVAPMSVVCRWKEGGDASPAEVGGI